MAYNPHEQAQHHHQALTRHLDTVAQWLVTRNVLNTPAYPNRAAVYHGTEPSRSAYTSRTKADVADAPAAAVNGVMGTIDRITQVLDEQHDHIWQSRCHRYGDELPELIDIPPHYHNQFPIAVHDLCDSIAAAAHDLTVWVRDRWHFAIGLSDMTHRDDYVDVHIRPAVTAIGDCEHEVYTRIVADWIREPRAPQRPICEIPGCYRLRKYARLGLCDTHRRRQLREGPAYKEQAS